MRAVKRALGVILVVLGAGLLTAAALLFWYNGKESREAGLAADAVLPQIQKQIAYSAAKQETESLMPPQTLSAAEPPPTILVEGEEYLGVLSIPSLELTLPVMADWTEDALRRAPCREYGSIAEHNLVIAGHNYTRHFGRLRRLRPGDSVEFTDMAGVSHRYAVAFIETLAPEQVDDMRAGQFDLSLYTCTYGGKTRLTIRCEETAGEE